MKKREETSLRPKNRSWKDSSGRSAEFSRSYEKNSL